MLRSSVAEQWKYNDIPCVVGSTPTGATGFLRVCVVVEGVCWGGVGSVRGLFLLACFYFDIRETCVEKYWLVYDN